MICATAVLALATAPAVAAQYILTDLGDLPGGPDLSNAYEINNAGQVTGVSIGATGSRAFLLSGGVMQVIGDMPGGSDNSYAYGINDAGQVVGLSIGTTGLRAFLWSGGVMQDLGDLPGGGDSSFAAGINDAGQVVGHSAATAGNRAFLWSGGVLQDLNGLIDASGWTLTNARGINNLGQVVGWGFDADGAQRGFLLTPVSAAVPEPSTWAMMLPGFFGLGAVIRRRALDLRDEFKSAPARPHSG